VIGTGRLVVLGTRPAGDRDRQAGCGGDRPAGDRDRQACFAALNVGLLGLSF
jgi:hypothetical protein